MDAQYERLIKIVAIVDQTVRAQPATRRKPFSERDLHMTFAEVARRCGFRASLVKGSLVVWEHTWVRVLLDIGTVEVDLAGGRFKKPQPQLWFHGCDRDYRDGRLPDGPPPEPPSARLISACLAAVHKALPDLEIAEKPAREPERATR